MKPIIALIVFLFFTTFTWGQKIDQSQVPAVLLNSFQLKYPNSEHAKWKKEKENYTIEFQVNNKPHKAILSYKGNLIEHFKDLYVSEIPEVVLETIKTRIPYFDVEDADKYENGRKTTYTIKFKIDGKRHYFWVNEKGELRKYRQELKDSEIPIFISSLIATNYGKMDIDYSKFVEEQGVIIYIVDGEINDDDHNFKFDAKGNILKHIHDIKLSEIPAPIIKTISSKFKDHTLRDADFIEENGKSYYYITMKKSKNQVYITLNPNGQVLTVK
ncbi:hypothetical protein MWU65_13990 [Cellulophaga sp. F20128]|uniref:PepSY-like domain-containing protein n=1 Tax=Cellulophaga sp. F20128 TaxID=2926413 RepID=UPI001FF28394|nr:PepSY-like domain-containing protein [Cellulophaga sp. F20128]MCK0158302.1 hypothetical protein [Cellulophaga sp. F20128]